MEMKKEDADQLIRCVKECWWRVGILLLLVSCFVLLAIHGWPQGDWALGWGAIGAIATIVTGCAAVLIAYRQKKSNDEFRANLDWVATRDANQLLNEIHHELTFNVLLETENILKAENLNFDSWLRTLKDVIAVRKRLPRADVRFDSQNFLDECLINALYDLKKSILELDDDPQVIDFEGNDLEELRSKDSGLNVLALWLQNELVVLSDVVACAGQGFACLGFIELKEAMVRRFGRAIKEVQKIGFSSPIA